MKTSLLNEEEIPLKKRNNRRELNNDIDNLEEGQGLALTADTEEEALAIYMAMNGLKHRRTEYKLIVQKQGLNVYVKKLRTTP